MSNLKRIFTAGLMLVTVLSMSMVVAPQADAAASAGDLIKMDGLSSVYYLGADGKRYVFPNEATYFSWYSDFSSVVTIPQSELESYPLGSNVTMRPGTELIKITTDPKVYAVESDGSLVGIADEAAAEYFYGEDWSQRVVDIPDSFFTNYTIQSEELEAGDEYPEGSLVQLPGESDVYYINADGEAQAIADESAFLANRFQWNDVITADESYELPSMGDELTEAEEDLVDTSQGGGGGVGVQPGTGSGLTVALASDTPASASIPQNASVSFLKFNLTASNDGDVSISTIKLTAGGLGNAENIDSAAMYNDGQRVGNTKNVDSNNEAHFNFSSPIVVQAGATESIIVKAKVTAGTGQHNLGIEAASDISTNGAAVSGSFPIVGNSMSATDVSVGQLTVDDNGDPADVDLGDEGATVAKLKVSSDSVEDIYLNAITLKNTGSCDDNDMENMKLYHGTSEVAASESGLVDDYVTFTLDTPLLVEKDNNEKLEVRADIVDGAGKTVALSLNDSVDVDAEGDYYGTAASVSNTVAAQTVNINAGQVALAKENAPSEKVRSDQTNVVFGTFKLTVSSGATAELQKMKLTVDGTNDTASTSGFDSIENVEVIVNSAIYEMSSSTEATNDSVVEYENEDMGLILANGATYEMVVRADIKSTATDQKYTFKIADAASDLYMVETTDDTQISDITPNSVSLKQVEVQDPAVTFSTSPLSSSYSAVVGSSDVQALLLNVEANETDDLSISELKFKDNDSDSITSSIVSGFNLYKGEVNKDNLVASESGSSLSGEEITFNNLTETVSAGETNQYILTVDFVNDDTYNGTSTQWYLSGYSIEDVTETDNVYDTAIDTDEDGAVDNTSEVLSSRTITLAGTGSLYVEMDNSNDETDKDSYVVAGNTSDFLAAIKLRAENENVMIEDMVVDVGKGNSVISQMIDTLYLIDSDKTTVIGEETNISASTTFDNLSYEVGQTSQTVYLRADFNPIGKDMVGVTDASTTFRVYSVTADGTQSGNALSLDNNDTTCDSAGICYGSTYDATSTAVSKEVTSVGIKMSDVDLVDSAEGTAVEDSLTTGWNNVAIIEVQADSAGNNTLANGDEMKLMVDQIRVLMEAHATNTVSDARISRIGGSGNSTSTDITGTIGTSTSVTFPVASSTTADDEVSSSETAYYLVEAYVDNMDSNATDWVKVSLENLNGSSGSSAFKWRDGNDTGTDYKYPLRLENTSIDGSRVQEAV